MRKKLLLMPAYSYPEQDSSSHLGYDRNSALIENGYDLVLYAATPTRGVSRDIRKEYRRIKCETRHDNHMIVHRYYLPRERKSATLRAIRYSLQCVKLFNRAVFCKDARSCDVMWISSTPPLKGAVLGFAKCITKIPLVYNLQDVFPDSLAGTGLAKRGGMLWKLGLAIARYTYKKSDAITVISQDSYDKLVSRGVPKEKLFLVYNWIDSSSIIPVEDKDNPLFEEFGISKDKFRVVYAGNLGNAQNIDIIIDAASILRENESIEFIIFGSGGKENELKKCIEKKGLKNIKMLPLQTYDRVSFVYSLGSVCVVSCRANFGGAAMPSKTWTIMSCGRPVLASFDEGELARIITSNQCGIFTHSEKLDEFVSAIHTLNEDLQLCKTLGRNARLFIENNLSKEAGVSTFLKVINKVYNQKQNERTQYKRDD